MHPVCAEGEMEINITVKNVTSRIVTIQSGVPPWDHTPVGTSFSARAGTEPLKFKPIFVPIGRTGPIHIQPGEEKKGDVPIVQLFPSISEKLKATPVSVQWSYTTDLESAPMVGTLEIVKDPCLR
jgi:hypothetical protein